MNVLRISEADLRDVAAALGENQVAVEMCLPSYAHKNPLVRWLFWSRLDRAVEMAAIQPTETVLDYASGLGVMLPTLSRLAKRVVAMDLDVAASRRMVERRHLTNAELLTCKTDVESLVGLVPNGSVDCVIALDVLEHVERLDRVASVIKGWLSPRGRLIVSGPTESLAYRIGRTLAGYHKHYGHAGHNVYHERDVFEVRRILEAHGFGVVEEDRLPPRPLPRAFVMMKLVPR